MQFQETSEQLCERVAAQSSGVCLLAFSAGKDSIAAYVQVKKYFKKIVPYYLYSIPKLGFVERALDYYESQIGMKIARYPHPGLYRMLNNFVFQPPENKRAIVKADLPEFDYQDLYRILREDFKLAENCPVANGVRACDSPMRRIAIVKYGAYRLGAFNAVFDWNKQRVIDAIKDSGMKLPVDYKIFGRSFDGLDYRFLAGIKENFPEDFQKILDLFPMAELELKRHEYRERYFNELSA